MHSLIILGALLALTSVQAFDVNRLNIVLPDVGNIWALLVAGSNTYGNYRHQADTCHAYQVLHNHGVPDERIVVMMYDDIAHNQENPMKGKIINHPNGKDVYAGVLKDYVGEDVTPENFLNILQGNATAMKGIGSGRVIESGPNDHVFVNFADHGAPGLIAFPNGELYAKPLNKALLSMHSKKRFGKLVLYIEACESGSMFAKLLPKDINVFATTAANATESSYATYYDAKLGTYLGDLYSVNWMEDSDKEVLTKESLQTQFKLVREETNLSHVQEFGDMTISSMKVSEFFGAKTSTAGGYDLPKVLFDAVPSPEVPIYVIKQLMEATNSFEDQQKLKRKLDSIIRNRDFLEDTVKKIIAKATLTDNQAEQVFLERFELGDFDCYETAARYFSKNCFSLSKNDYALRYMYAFVNMCETGISSDTVIQAMEEVCVHPPIHGIL